MAMTKGWNRVCPNCGKEFVANWNVRKYCGEKCAREFRNKRRRQVYKEVHEAW